MAMLPTEYNELIKILGSTQGNRPSSQEYFNRQPQNMQAAGGNYKDGQVVTQNGIRYIAHGGKLLTQAEVVKDKNLFNKYSNLVSNKEIGDTNGPPPAVATDNSVISAPGGGKPPVKPVGVNPANDPNNLPYNNPESNRPIFPTSYTGQISLGI